MGISQIGGTRFITKPGSVAGVLIPNVTGTSCATPPTDQSYGSWVQMVASTAVEYVITQVTARVTSASTSQQGPIHIDIGTGVGGSEVTLDTVSIYGTAALPTDATHSYLGGSAALTVPLRIPAGSRLVFRAALYNTNSASNSVTVFMHAAPYANLE